MDAIIVGVLRVVDVDDEGESDRDASERAPAFPARVPNRRVPSRFGQHGSARSICHRNFFAPPQRTTSDESASAPKLRTIDFQAPAVSKGLLRQVSYPLHCSPHPASRVSR